MPHGTSSEHSHDGLALHRHLRKHTMTEVKDHTFGTGATKFFREDGTWAAVPPGGISKPLDQVLAFWYAG